MGLVPARAALTIQCRMPYTLWHAGIQIGETAFEQTHGRQKIGVLRPTAYGLEILPKLIGFLSAASNLKDEMASRGMTADGELRGLDALLKSSDPGRRILDLGKELREVEVHDGTGKRIEFRMIVFSDLWELRALCRKLGRRGGLPAEEPTSRTGPRYIVSVTLGKSPVAFPRFGVTSRDN